MVEDLFKGAREHGAVPLDRAGKGPGEPGRAKVKRRSCVGMKKSSWRYREGVLFMAELKQITMKDQTWLNADTDWDIRSSSYWSCFVPSCPLGLCRWRLQAWGGSWRGVNLCGRREARLQQPARCEHFFYFSFVFLKPFVSCLACLTLLNFFKWDVRQ